jgi:hypothetical protein
MPRLDIENVIIFHDFRKVLELPSLQRRHFAIFTVPQPNIWREGDKVSHVSSWSLHFDQNPMTAPGFHALSILGRQ